MLKPFFKTSAFESKVVPHVACTMHAIPHFLARFSPHASMGRRWMAALQAACKPIPTHWLRGHTRRRGGRAAEPPLPAARAAAGGGGRALLPAGPARCPPVGPARDALRRAGGRRAAAVTVTEGPDAATPSARCASTRAGCRARIERRG